MRKEIQIQIEKYKKYRTLIPMSENEIRKYTDRRNTIRKDTADKKSTHTLDKNYKKILFGEGNIESWQEKITEIRFSGVLLAESVIRTSGTDICADISEEKNGSVIGWVEQINNGAEYILHIDANGKIDAPADSADLFEKFSQVKKIKFGDVFDTKNVTSMFGMFCFCKNLSELNVSRFNTANVTDMSNMFRECSKLEELDVSGFHTENVMDMSYMFSGCSELEELDVSGFHTGNVTDMSYMFNCCSELKELDVSGFHTGNVMDMSFMFDCCGELDELDVSRFDTHNVTWMDSMFHGCKNLETVDVSGFHTENVTDMKWMFSFCSNLKTVDVSGFHTENVTDMYFMFSWCDNLEIVDISGFHMQNISHHYDSMFEYCPKLNRLPIAIKFFKEKRYKDAISLLKKYESIKNEEKTGDAESAKDTSDAKAAAYAEAQYLLGVCYYQGLDVKKDREKAWEYFRAAAAQGQVDAQILMLDPACDWDEIISDYTAVFKSLEESSDSGNANAQYLLSVCYLKKLGTEKGNGLLQKHMEKRFHLCEAAASQGHAKAQKELGDFYFSGLVTERDYEKAYEWYQKALDQGEEIDEMTLITAKKGSKKGVLKKFSSWLKG